MNHSVIFFRFVTFILWLLSWPLASYSSPLAHWQNPRYIEQSFYEIALKNEFRQGETRIRKWHKPLAVYIDHQVGDAALHQQLLTMHLKHLGNITKLPINYVNKQSLANIKVFFTRASDVNRIISSEISPRSVSKLRGSVCMANIRINKNYEIERAIVIIPVDTARMHGKLIACVVEELTQILGLPNDSKTIYPTIFSDRNRYKLLTGLDYLFLKLLYSAQIKSGMSKAEIKADIQALLKNWQQDGSIIKAQSQVVKGDLYKLLGYH